MNIEKFTEWLRAALIRALRTFAQTAAAALGVCTMLSDVSWYEVISTASMAALLSLIMSAAGLPEVKDSE